MKTYSACVLMWVIQSSTRWNLCCNYLKCLLKMMTARDISVVCLTCFHHWYYLNTFQQWWMKKKSSKKACSFPFMKRQAEFQRLMRVIVNKYWLQWNSLDTNCLYLHNWMWVQTVNIRVKCKISIQHRCQTPVLHSHHTASWFISWTQKLLS